MQSPEGLKDSPFTLVPEKTEGRKERICGLKKHRAGLIKALQK